MRYTEFTRAVFAREVAIVGRLEIYPRGKLGERKRVRELVVDPLIELARGADVRDLARVTWYREKDLAKAFAIELFGGGVRSRLHNNPFVKIIWAGVKRS